MFVSGRVFPRVLACPYFKKHRLLIAPSTEERDQVVHTRPERETKYVYQGREMSLVLNVGKGFVFVGVLPSKIAVIVQSPTGCWFRI